MNKLMTSTGAALTLLAAITAGISQAHAAGEMTFKGTLIEPPPCVINGSKPIDVDFGTTVMTSRVDGVNYIKDITYSLVCDKPALNTMRMQIKGTAAPFSAAALNTDKADLAITIKSGGKEFPVNTWLNFTHPTQPVLQAVPIKKAGAELKGGAFAAQATMMIDYQ